MLFEALGSIGPELEWRNDSRSQLLARAWRAARD